MRKNRGFEFVLASLALLVLQGCKGARNRAECMWDNFGSAEGMVNCALVDRSFSEVFSEKYVPTSLFWVALAIIAVWLPLRSMKGWQIVAYTGIGFFIPSGIAFLYHWLNGLAFLIGLILLVTGSAILAAIIAVASKILIPLKLLHTGIKLAKGQIDEAAKGAMKRKGIEPEKDFTVQTALLFGFGLLGSIIVVAILFGGPVSLHPSNKAAIIDLILRGMGCLMATVSAGYVVYDAMHSNWLCMQCETRVWDLGQNKEFCPNHKCQHPNPRVSWVCDCGHENFSSENPYRCGGANCNKKVRKGLHAKWIEFSEPGANCEKCGKRVGDDDLFCPNKVCKFPNPKKEYECHKCFHDNPGTDLVCQRCKEPRKKLTAEWLEEAKRVANPPPLIALPPGPAPRLALLPHNPKLCPGCNAPVADGVQSCGECGTSVAGMAKSCPGCKSPVADGVQSCGECGAAVN